MRGPVFLCFLAARFRHGSLEGKRVPSRLSGRNKKERTKEKIALIDRGGPFASFVNGALSLLMAFISIHGPDHAFFECVY